MNTVRADRDGVQDMIADPAAAARWLRATRPEVGIGTVGREAVAELRELRDALRLLAAAATGDDREPAVSAAALKGAVGAVNRACAGAPSWSELQWSDEEDPGEAGLEGGPRRVVRTAHAPGARGRRGHRGGGRRPVRRAGPAAAAACRAPGCVLYFVRNHPRREWCSDGCGNRARVARHYQRHHGSDREGD